MKTYSSPDDNFYVNVFYVKDEPSWNPPFKGGWAFNAHRSGERFAFNTTNFNNLFPSEQEAMRAGKALVDKCYEDLVLSHPECKI